MHAGVSKRRGNLQVKIRGIRDNGGLWPKLKRFREGRHAMINSSREPVLAAPMPQRHDLRFWNQLSNDPRVTRTDTPKTNDQHAVKQFSFPGSSSAL